MGAELPAVPTPCTPEEMQRALFDAWQDVFAEEATQAQVATVMAQVAEETGRFRKMIAWNIGNIKGNLVVDHCYFTTAEHVDPTTAETLLAGSTPGGLVESKGPLPDGKVLVVLHPNHPGCRFLAFRDLPTACAAYLAKIEARFPHACAAMKAGDPEGFAQALKRDGYYTGDEAEYATALRQLGHEYMRLEWPPEHTNDVDEECAASVV